MATATNHHPKALPFLFLTEMWERFGFYVAQGLLVLYMTQQYGFSDNESYTISGAFAGLIYIAPLVGGIIADRLIGFRTAIIWGGFFLVAGYVFLALSNPGFLFFLSLSTIIVGNGLLKPNISSLLGSQYEEDDPRREAGFTLFYIGINIGAALSGISGYIKASYGWSVTFSLAAVGMVIGLITFAMGLKYLKPSIYEPKISKANKKQLFLACCLAVLGVSFFMQIDVLADWLLPTTGIVLLIFLITLTVQQDPEYRKSMVLLDFLILSSIVFWTLFLQLFNSANLYVDRLVEKNILGIPLTTTVFYASESVFIIILGPLFAYMWRKLSDINKNPSPVAKFSFGIFFAGLGFLVLGCSTYFPTDSQLIDPLWIFGAYALITIGELCLSPIGLSAVTQLAPPHIVGMMMGTWFVATGFGGIFAGWIAKHASIPNQAMSVAAKLDIYQRAFFEYAYLAFFFAIVLFLIHLTTKKMLQD